MFSHLETLLRFPQPNLPLLGSETPFQKGKVTRKESQGCSQMETPALFEQQVEDPPEEQIKAT